MRRRSPANHRRLAGFRRAPPPPRRSGEQRLGNPRESSSRGQGLGWRRRAPRLSSLFLPPSLPLCSSTTTWRCPSLPFSSARCQGSVLPFSTPASLSGCVPLPLFSLLVWASSGRFPPRRVPFLGARLTSSSFCRCARPHRTAQIRAPSDPASDGPGSAAPPWRVPPPSDPDRTHSRRSIKSPSRFLCPFLTAQAWAATDTWRSRMAGKNLSVHRQ